MIPTTLRLSPLLQVSENGAVEIRHESRDLQSALYPNGYKGGVGRCDSCQQVQQSAGLDDKYFL